MLIFGILFMEVNIIIRAIWTPSDREIIANVIFSYEYNIIYVINLLQLQFKSGLKSLFYNVCRHVENISIPPSHLSRHTHK